MNTRFGGYNIFIVRGKRKNMQEGKIAQNTRISGFEKAGNTRFGVQNSFRVKKSKKISKKSEKYAKKRLTTLACLYIIIAA